MCLLAGFYWSGGDAAEEEVLSAGFGAFSSNIIAADVGAPVMARDAVPSVCASVSELRARRVGTVLLLLLALLLEEVVVEEEEKA